MQRSDIKVEGSVISAFLHPAAATVSGNPVLVALHGGTYTSEYFCVAGSSCGSFADIATRNGFSVLRVDRPGYGSSELLEENENTFARQAELIDAAIATLVEDLDIGAVILVGHSIGGMVALELAARRPTWPLAGVAVAGMGAQIPPGGAAEELAALPLSGVVDLPIEERERLWYGPQGTVSDDVIVSARASFAPAPMVELKAAPLWAQARLAVVAAAIDVPVHHRLGQFDALWDTSTEARDLFVSRFGPDHAISSELLPGVGHCVDHHLLGAALHYQQLAFAHQSAHRLLASHPA